MAGENGPEAGACSEGLSVAAAPPPGTHWPDHRLLALSNNFSLEASSNGKNYCI